MARPMIDGAAHTATNFSKPSSPTWPITMFCGLPIRVAAEPALLAPASAGEVGPRIEAAARKAGAQQRRHDEDDHIVHQNRRQPPPIETVSASSTTGPPRCSAIQAAHAS